MERSTRRFLAAIYQRVCATANRQAQELGGQVRKG